MLEPDIKHAVKVYATDHPRILGLFHKGPAVGFEKASHVGLITHIGPCRCGNPDHKYPEYYAVSPCIYVRGWSQIITCRIPEWLAYAFLWISGSP